MCGIVGLVGHATAELVPILSKMANSLTHRGPDGEGTWTDASVALGFAHRRLSVIDTSDRGAQPMVSARGRLVLNYNGEIYNHRALRADLERTGKAPEWRGNSDTEVLLAALEAWGVDATLRRCNGMFALALWDTQRRVLTLARDRMGEKPLYFGWVGGRFAFASEMKALAKLPEWSPRMHVEAITSFLSTGYVRGPQSALAGIFRLPPGSALTMTLEQLLRVQDWDQLSLQIQRYWSLNSISIAGQGSQIADADAAVDDLEALLHDAVGLRMTADVPLGAFLSGGIDSSLVTALMQAQSTRRVRTFSIGFDEPDFDEAAHASAVAGHLGTDHTELYVGANDALALIPQLAATFDEPFADASQIPTLLLSELASRYVTVVLSGDGGDEVFAGYGRYFAIQKLWRLLGPLPETLRRGIASVLGTSAAALHPLSAIASAGNRLPQRLGRLADRLVAHDVDDMRLLFIGGMGKSRVHDTKVSRDTSHCLPPSEIRGTLRRLMYGDQLDYLPDDILNKLDRASMAYSLEARVPLLDHRLVEFSWRLSTEMLADGDRGKQPLRRVLDRYVPHAMIERPKQGFSPPIDTWLRGPLRDWAESLLTPEALRDLPMLDAGGVRYLWNMHLQCRMEAGHAIWNVLILSDWRNRIRATS